MIDKKIDFVKVNIAVITLSDSRNYEDDNSGKTLKELISIKGHNISHYQIIEDEPSIFTPIIENLSKSKDHDVIITTGGTGLTGRDNTIDSLKKISELEIPGFGELFRQLSYNKIGTSTIQSRSTAFLINKKYIFCLPGSTSAVKDAWNDILFYQLDIRHKPCNFIELIPRLDE
tara:strand:- start:1542 stop:2063 length:522 start_codon:yes stop_codon:yes gene_type:complete